MDDFDYERADDESAALAALADPGTMAIAGGTELLNWMRLGVAQPERIVDIGGLPGSGDITSDERWLTIGASATLNKIERDPAVRGHATVLAEACLKAASAQIRNRATLGGNVLQRTRCAYFRSEEPLVWACNKRRAGSGCGAREGIDTDAAIFGWSDICVATQPSDPVVALACLDAEIDLAGPDGNRRVPVTAFHRVQAETEDAGDETVLAPGELIRGFRIPIAPGESSAYVKVRERQSYAYALVTAAAAVRFEEGTIAAARIALGSVAQRPWRLPAAETALIGVGADAEAIRAIVTDAMSDARPLAGNGYKCAMAADAAVRAILEAAP